MVTELDRVSFLPPRWSNWPLNQPRDKPPSWRPFGTSYSMHFTGSHDSLAHHEQTLLSLHLKSSKYGRRPSKNTIRIGRWGECSEILANWDIPFNKYGLNMAAICSDGHAATKEQGNLHTRSKEDSTCDHFIIQLVYSNLLVCLRGIAKRDLFGCSFSINPSLSYHICCESALHRRHCDHYSG